MISTVLVVFIAVYVGMVLGEIPGLRLDRAGIALLGAIALVATGDRTPAGAWAAVDAGTIALLFGLMWSPRSSGSAGSTPASSICWPAPRRRPRACSPV